MGVTPAEQRASRIAAAIGEAARTRMLYCLMDGRARTATELALVGDVTPATASAHLARLKEDRLVAVLAQGKHRYYHLASSEVAEVMEALSVVAGFSTDALETRTPSHLRAARSCYDHAAGALGVALHDRLAAMGWTSGVAGGRKGTASGRADYEITAKGERRLLVLGIDAGKIRGGRRRLAFACVDWSERRPHLGGALAAALLDWLLERRWVTRERDSRALTVTAAGRRGLLREFGCSLD
jgi:DNA-binding transcriptional ArsR family regulator